LGGFGTGEIGGMAVGQGVGAHSPSGLGAVLRVLRRDPGVQELTPYLSRFFYQQIRANTKRLLLLRTVVRAVQALLGNERVALDFHLQQLLPAALTCGVAAKLGAMTGEVRSGKGLREKCRGVK
jgi:hypothetical protein